MKLVIDEYTDHTRGRREPTLVHRTGSDETLMLLADASNTAFSRRYQPLIDVVKECFRDAVDSGDGPLPERMRHACVALGDIMQERFVDTPRFGKESYSMVFAALGVVGRSVAPMWNGSPQARLLRNGVPVRETMPHVTKVPGSERIFTSELFTAQPGSADKVAQQEPWPLMPDDILVLADHRLFSLFSDRELIGIIDRGGAGRAAALVEAAQASSPVFARSAIIARVVDCRGHRSRGMREPNR